MPAKSEAQQKAAGMALAAKRGYIAASDLNGAAKDMYDSMNEKDLEDFASTTHDDLDKVQETTRLSKEYARMKYSAGLTTDFTEMLQEFVAYNERDMKQDKKQYDALYTNITKNIKKLQDFLKDHKSDFEKLKLDDVDDNEGVNGNSFRLFIQDLMWIDRSVREAIQRRYSKNK